MKGSDKVRMTINICGELIQLDVPIDDQYKVREAERAVKQYVDHLKKAWPDNSDRNILAMTAYQFAKSYHQLMTIQQEAIEITNARCNQIDAVINPSETA